MARNLVHKKTNLERNVEQFFKLRFKRNPLRDQLYFDEWVYRFKYHDNSVLAKLMDDESVIAWYGVTGVMVRPLEENDYIKQAQLFKSVLPQGW